MKKTLHNRNKRKKDIIYIAENIALERLNNRMTAMDYFKSQLVTYFCATVNHGS